MTPLAFEWMIVGAVVAYALAAPIVLWLFAARTSDRVALSALALSTSLYLVVIGIETAKIYFAGVNNFFLELPPKAYSQFVMLAGGYRSGAYSTATTVATICIMILIWDRWARQKKFGAAFIIAASAMGLLFCLTYAGPLVFQFVRTEERNIADFFLALADIVFFIWAFVLIARSEAVQRFFSLVPEKRK